MKRTTWILVAILVVLIAVTVFVLQQPGEQSSPAEIAAMLVSYDSSSVDRIDIAQPSGIVTITRENERWTLTSPLRATADTRAVHEAISKGRTLSLKTLVSSNPAKQQLFQLDSAGTLVRIYAKGTEAAAFRIGKLGPTYTETYVRREGSDDVYLTDGMLATVFAKSPRDWRNKMILGLKPEDIRSVRFQYGDTTFTLSLSDSAWNVDGEAATEYAVRGFLASLTSLQCDDFIDSTLTSVPPLIGSLETGGIQIRFFQNPGDSKSIVIASNGTQVYSMYAWRGEQVLKRKKDFTGK
jgi:hypothetical protein